MQGIVITATPTCHPVSHLSNAPQARRVFGAVARRQRSACRCAYRLGTLKGATLHGASFPPPPLALLASPTGHAAAQNLQAGLLRSDDMEQASLAVTAHEGVI